MEKRALNLSRRKFTKEFKLAAVRRLEMGASAAEVARACEIDANVLHRWRREFREGVETAFPGLGRKRESEENRLASEKSGGSGVSGGPLGMTLQPASRTTVAKVRNLRRFVPLINIACRSLLVCP